MPQLNLLLLPLLGGFLFVNIWHPTRYYVQRAGGYKLIFISAICGVALLFLASVSATYLPEISVLRPYCQALDTLWHKSVPMSQSGEAALSGKAILSMVLGLSAGPLNLLSKLPLCHFLNSENTVVRIIIRKADPLENLFRAALAKRKLVLITMKNDKVYVGFVARNLNPAFPMESVGIIPAFSGYRDAATKQMFLAVNYDTVRAALEKEMKSPERRELVMAEYREKMGGIIKRQLMLLERSVPSSVPHSSDEEEAKLSARLQPTLERIVDQVIDQRISEKLNDFQIIVRADEIQSGTIFDADVYQAHFQPKPKPAPTIPFE